MGAVRYFHQADDPYSHLAVQLLARLQAAYGVPVEVFLVPAPEVSAAPEPERLAAWSLRDAVPLAAAHGLDWPAGAVHPTAARLAQAQQALASAALLGADFADQAARIGQALWTADDNALAAFPKAPADDLLSKGQEARSAGGHYLGGVFQYDEQWFWGPDRFHYLEATLSPHRRPGAQPAARLLQESPEADRPTGGIVDFFLSFRSPYTHLAVRRVRELTERCGATLRLRPVLPMVMRGLPVPMEKRIYITRDCWREAVRMGIPFGKVHDPVGLGVERGMGVMARAMALGKGAAFAESFLAGAFADGIDATTDEGLATIAERAGLTADDIAIGLADEAWRDTAEANRQEMFDLGLWGVPSFRVVGRPGHWGQDRLWAIEQDLIAIAQERAA